MREVNRSIRRTVFCREIHVEVERIVEARLSTRWGLLEDGEDFSQASFDVFGATAQSRGTFSGKRQALNEYLHADVVLRSELAYALAALADHSARLTLMDEQADFALVVLCALIVSHGRQNVGDNGQTRLVIALNGEHTFRSLIEHENTRSVPPVETRRTSQSGT